MMTRLRYHELVSGANLATPITKYDSERMKGGSYPRPVLSPLTIAVIRALRAWRIYHGTR